MTNHEYCNIGATTTDDGQAIIMVCASSINISMEDGELQWTMTTEDAFKLSDQLINRAVAATTMAAEEQGHSDAL
jgi:pseudouridine-5'-phosphate glycosidase